MHDPDRSQEVTRAPNRSEGPNVPQTPTCFTPTPPGRVSKPTARPCREKSGILPSTALSSWRIRTKSEIRCQIHETTTTAGILSRKMVAKTLMVLASKGALCRRVVPLITTNLPLCPANHVLHTEIANMATLCTTGSSNAPSVGSLDGQRLSPWLTANGTDAWLDSTFGRVHVSSFA